MSDDDFIGMMSAVFGQPVVLFEGKDGDVDGLLFVLDKPNAATDESDKTEKDEKEE
jgi:hypothetical protein